eukprot:m.5257 g.5257  ORF g.5257 m.5257 type:complete len:520 (-) comp3256_c0_seq1:113-1672(-)
MATPSPTSIRQVRLNGLRAQRIRLCRNELSKPHGSSPLAKQTPISLRAFISEKETEAPRYIANFLIPQHATVVDLQYAVRKLYPDFNPANFVLEVEQENTNMLALVTPEAMRALRTLAAIGETIDLIIRRKKLIKLGTGELCGATLSIDTNNSPVFLRDEDSEVSKPKRSNFVHEDAANMSNTDSSNNGVSETWGDVAFSVYEARKELEEALNHRREVDNRILQVVQGLRQDQIDMLRKQKSKRRHVQPKRDMTRSISEQHARCRIQEISEFREQNPCTQTNTKHQSKTESSHAANSNVSPKHSDLPSREYPHPEESDSEDFEGLERARPVTPNPDTGQRPSVPRRSSSRASTSSLTSSMSHMSLVDDLEELAREDFMNSSRESQTRRKLPTPPSLIESDQLKTALGDITNIASTNTPNKSRTKQNRREFLHHPRQLQEDQIFGFYWPCCQHPEYGKTATFRTFKCCVLYCVILIFKIILNRAAISKEGCTLKSHNDTSSISKQSIPYKYQDEILSSLY